MMPESLPIIARDYGTLFCRQGHGRRLAAEFGEKVRFLRFRRPEMTRLHMAEAADLFRNARQRHRNRVLLRREPRQDLLDHRLVVGDELAFRAAFFAVAENIEWCAAQEFEARE